MTLNLHVALNVMVKTDLRTPGPTCHLPSPEDPLGEGWGPFTLHLSKLRHREGKAVLRKKCDHRKIDLHGLCLVSLSAETKASPHADVSLERTSSSSIQGQGDQDQIEHKSNPYTGIECMLFKYFQIC